MNNEQDKQIQDLFKVVQAKKAEIAKAEKPNWETNTSFGYDPESSSRQNLQVLTKVEDLVRIMAFIIEKEEFHEKANYALGTTVKFNWMGFTVAEWMADIKTRISKIEITKKKSELEKLETRLNAIISPEMRRKMELDEITALLNKRTAERK